MSATREKVALDFLEVRRRLVGLELPPVEAVVGIALARGLPPHSHVASPVMKGCADYAPFPETSRCVV